MLILLLIVLTIVLVIALVRQIHQTRQMRQRWLASFDSAWYWHDSYQALRETIESLAYWHQPNDHAR